MIGSSIFPKQIMRGCDFFWTSNSDLGAQNLPHLVLDFRLNLGPQHDFLLLSSDPRLFLNPNTRFHFDTNASFKVIASRCGSNSVFRLRDIPRVQASSHRVHLPFATTSQRILCTRLYHMLLN
ncbi:hypothetical protein PR003_g10166 [Phytophthora rubi]|uniref:Uncharacterized protein n=1 Tax=Phytophthora rubi TaxID=129364 RepID=A0A6A4FEU4_9STRA|nr:hypothetical protein PR003_g10166 [Phytophthora rubi]